MTDIDEALVQRMVKLVLDLIDRAPSDGHSQPHPAIYWRSIVEARAIAALLPEPVDPDIAEATLIYMSTFLAGRSSPTLEEALLAAIKRGRELARQDNGRE